MSVASIDRRRRRSTECRKAIEFQLIHLAEQYDLRNLVLADSAGLMVAADDDSSEARAIAAFGPLLARRLDRSTRGELIEQLSTFLPTSDAASISVRRFHLNGAAHFLCVVGNGRLRRQANIYRAVTGIRRIVDETREEMLGDD